MFSEQSANWSRLVERLKLPTEAAKLLFEAPGQFHRVAAIVAHEKANLTSAPTTDAEWERLASAYAGGVGNAIAFLYSAWIMLFEDWISACGASKVREAISRELETFRELACYEGS
jgi:hypothetical protein